MARKKKILKKSGLRPVHSFKRIEGEEWMLAEHLDDSREMALAKFEYQCEGYRVRCERVHNKLYYIWVAEGREKHVILLEGETIKRQKPRRIKLA